MTFLEAALEILKRERKPLHYKDLTERAMTRKLLTFVGRTPEVTMQTQLTNAVKKAPGNPFVRVKPGIFGLLRYPETALAPELEPEETAGEKRKGASGSESSERGEGHGRRRRRTGRGKVRGGEQRIEVEGAGAALGGEMTGEERDGDSDRDEAPDEPNVGAMSPEARAAALAESGVLESDDGDEQEDEGAESEGAQTSGGQAVGASSEGDEDEGEEGELEGEADSGVAAAPGEAGFEDLGTGRRRRRRRRRGRGRGNGMPEGFADSSSSASAGETGGAASAAEGIVASGEGAPGEPALPSGETPRAEGGFAEPAQGGGRRIMSPVDAAIEILKGQPPGRGVHVRQIADAAVRRRLIHGEPNEAWRVLRAALASEPRERLRAGLRPRVRAAGSGLYALSRRPPDMDLERAEHVFGEARRALRERTLAGLEQRLTELTPSGFEAIGRVLLQREGFGPATFVKRVEGTIYLEALRGRGSRPSRCLIGLRPGTMPAGRRAIGELRAGIRARNQDEGVLLLAGRLAEDAISEWRQPGPPIEVIDGSAMADTCIRHGVGVVNTMVSVDFVDADFFAEISEG